MKFNRWFIWLNVIFWLGMFLGHFYVEYPLKAGFNTLHDGIAFAYGLFINLITIYAFTIIAVPAYRKRPRVSTLIKYNLLFLIIMILSESLMDIAHQFFFNHIYKILDQSWEYYVQLVWANFLSMLFILPMANLYGFNFAWFDDQKKHQESEKEQLKAELVLMQQQIHPHFLFNTLNNLYGLACDYEDDTVANGIAQLANMMRYMVYDTKAEWVPLNSEINYIKNYIELQKIRVGSQIPIHFEVTGAAEKYRIAPLLLLPFVENVFKHGISFANPQPIYIKIINIDNALYFYSRNQKIDTQEVKGVGGFGLENVKKRLALLYPQNYKLEINQSNNQFTVELMIYNLLENTAA